MSFVYSYTDYVVEDFEEIVLFVGVFHCSLIWTYLDD